MLCEPNRETASWCPMDQKRERVRELEERAGKADTLAEAQALTDQADRLRNPRRGRWQLPPIFRN